MIIDSLNVATRSSQSVCCAIVCTIRGHRVKNWNIHSTWIIGILLAILIGSTSVDWNAIKDLPGIISFAVGLSSLILAVIAIFQTLSSTGSVEASLAAVREATAGSAAVSSELAASAVVIQQAATDAQTASSSAVTATNKFVEISNSIIESSEAGRLAVSKLREELTDKGTASSVGQASVQTSSEKAFTLYSMGGVALIYASIRSFETDKEFKLRDIFIDDQSMSWEVGYLSALSDSGLVESSVIDGLYKITKLNMINSDSLKEELKSLEYDGELQVDYIKRLAQVDAYFGK